MKDYSEDNHPIIIEAESFLPSPIVNAPPEHVFTLEEMITTWLDSKYNISQSKATRSRYERHLAAFRETLQTVGYDLDSEDYVTLATIAQGWASKLFIPPADTAPSTRASILARAQKLAPVGVAAGTYNGRLSNVSSFYVFAMRRKWLRANPIEMIDRRRQAAQDYARHIPKDDMDQRLLRIDRHTLTGKRDFAILLLAVMTGRRAAELIGLKWGDLLFDGSGNMTIIWRRCKGGKVMEDQATSGVRDGILDYLRTLHGVEHLDLSKESPIWVRLHWDRHSPKFGFVPLSVQGLRDICIKRLGVSKIHTTRHTFAVAMEAIGAPISDIGARLGHASLATTSVYLQRLHASENPYAQGLEQAYGVGNVTDEDPPEPLPHPIERVSFVEQALSSNPDLPRDRLGRVARVDSIILDNPDLSNVQIAMMAGVGASTVTRHRQALGLARPLGTNQSGPPRSRQP